MKLICDDFLCTVVVGKQVKGITLSVSKYILELHNFKNNGRSSYEDLS